MTAAHVFYIPCVLLLGMVVGYVMGGRAVRADLQKRRRRLRE
jgi:hypothetical protein